MFWWSKDNWNEFHLLINLLKYFVNFGNSTLNGIRCSKLKVGIHLFLNMNYFHSWAPLSYMPYRPKQIYEYLFIIKMSSLPASLCIVCCMLYVIYTLQRNPWLNRLWFWMTESFHVCKLWINNESYWCGRLI